MTDIRIIETDPEQGIVGYGYRNIRQYDMKAFHESHLVASLWQDREGNWHWTKRLYDIGTIEDVDTEYLEDKSVLGIINQFAVEVYDWLNDEISYLTSIKISIDDMEVECE